MDVSIGDKLLEIEISGREADRSSIQHDRLEH